MIPVTFSNYKFEIREIPDTGISVTWVNAPGGEQVFGFTWKTLCDSDSLEGRNLSREDSEVILALARIVALAEALALVDTKE